MDYSESDMAVYNSLYSRITKFGVNLSLYNEQFHPKAKLLVFSHKYHLGWVITVSDTNGISVYENFYE